MAGVDPAAPFEQTDEYVLTGVHRFVLVPKELPATPDHHRRVAPHEQLDVQRLVHRCPFNTRDGRWCHFSRRPFIVAAWTVLLACTGSTVAAQDTKVGFAVGAALPGGGIALQEAATTGWADGKQAVAPPAGLLTEGGIHSVGSIFGRQGGSEFSRRRQVYCRCSSEIPYQAAVIQEE